MEEEDERSKENQEVINILTFLSLQHGAEKGFVQA